MRCDRCGCSLFSCQCPGGAVNDLLDDIVCPAPNPNAECQILQFRQAIEFYENLLKGGDNERP